jgi:Spy/CpxP family protein refolding chaperone
MLERGFVRGLVATAAVATAAIGIAAPAAAQGGGEPEGGPPGVGVGFAGATEARWLERHASELGLDEPTLAKVRAIGEEASGAWNRHVEELRAESRRLSEGLAAELPDEAALAKQAQAMGRVWTEGLEERLRATVKLRKLLTPEQRQKAAELRKKQPARRRGGP